MPPRRRTAALPWRLACLGRLAPLLESSILPACLHTVMILGRADRGDTLVRFRLDLACTGCQKQVPGGMAAPEKYFGTYSFFLEVDSLKKEYLCGPCRDAARIRNGPTRPRLAGA